MASEWNSATARRYEELTETHHRASCRVLVVLGILLIPAFSALDYLIDNQNFLVFLKIRAVATGLFVVAAAFIFTGRFLVNATTTGISMLSVAAALVTALCVAQGGFTSPYYNGIDLVVLAAVLLFSWTTAVTAAVVALVWSIYFLGVLASQGFVVDHWNVLFSNLFFMVSTGIIGIVGTTFRNHLRRESFLRLLAIEESQVQMQKSRDILQAELSSRAESLESLALEMRDRQQALHRAWRDADAAHDEAKRALELREEFLSTCSNELKTPLTALKLQVQLAKRQSESAVNGLLEMCEAQIGRIERLVDDMIDVTRIQSGTLTLKPTQFDLRGLVADVLDSLRPRFAAAGVEVQFPEGLSVLGTWDPDRIEQVIEALLANAIRYGSKKPVTISLRQMGDGAILEIQDRGIGIPREKLPKIFDRFERAAPSQYYGGLGLGLYIARRVVEAHGGAISVTSELGQGSTFKVVLPTQLNLKAVTLVRAAQAVGGDARDPSG